MQFCAHRKVLFFVCNLQVFYFLCSHFIPIAYPSTFRLQCHVHQSNFKFPFFAQSQISFLICWFQFKVVGSCSWCKNPKFLVSPFSRGKLWKFYPLQLWDFQVFSLSQKNFICQMNPKWMENCDKKLMRNELECLFDVTLSAFIIATSFSIQFFISTILVQFHCSFFEIQKSTSMTTSTLSLIW